MARKAKSLKMMISRKLFKSKKLDFSDAASHQSKSESNSSSSSEFKIKTSKKLQKLKRQLPISHMAVTQELQVSSKKEPIYVLKAVLKNIYQKNNKMEFFGSKKVRNF